MSARTALPVLCFAIPLMLDPTPSAQAGAWSLAPGEYYTEFRAGWFSAKTYHDADGDRLLLRRGGLWEERSLLSYTELGWKPRVGFVLGIPAKSVTRRFGVGGGRSVPSAAGLADGLLGFRYRLANGRAAAALELDWKPPFGYERSQFLTRADSLASGDTNGDGDSLDVNAARQLGSPVLGEGQQDLTLWLQLGSAVPRGFLQVAGGYKYRFEQPGDQIVVGADLGLWITRSLLLAGNYQGQVVLEDGERPTDEPDRHRVGPSLVYRVDDRLDLFVASLHTSSAKNALHSDEVFVGVAFKQTKLHRQQGFLGTGAAP